MLVGFIPMLFGIGFVSQPAAMIGTTGLLLLADGMFGASLPILP